MSISRDRASGGFLLIGLLAAGLLVQCGCSNDSEGSAADRPVPPAAVPDRTPEDEDRDGELKQPLIRALDDALDDVPEEDAEDIGTTKETARNILEEADDTLTRIKEQNREGIRRMNNPPRRVHPVRPPAEQESPESPAEAEPGT